MCITLPVVDKDAGWLDYVAAPGIVTCLIGARSLAESRDGIPVVLAGEVTGEQWKQYESFRPVQDGNILTQPIQASRALSMMIVCEEAGKSSAIEQIETWVNSPWKFRDQGKGP